jgi:release factor glutamine methyltransferase
VRLDESLVVARLRLAGCVFAEEEARLLCSAVADPAKLALMVADRATGTPLEHILGWAEFCGLRIIVDAGVFVPRRRTQFLARCAAVLTRRVAAVGGEPDQHRPVVVELCCGSGAVSAILLNALPAIELYATDLDPAAVRCARRNLPSAGVLQGDLFQPLPADLRGRVDVLVANAPYVPTEHLRFMPSEARVHEPVLSLDGGPVGLDVLRRVVGDAAHWLTPGGYLAVETGARQASVVAQEAREHGLIPRIARHDEAVVVISSRKDWQGRS